jgi:hypothetical protein
MSNTVRFVQLRRPISEILANDGTMAGAVFAANRFRDEILSLNSNTATEHYRARLIRQGDLWEQGIKLGIIMRKSEDDEANDEEVHGVAYYGGKWGVYLRAPDLWFELQDKPIIFFFFGSAIPVTFSFFSRLLSPNQTAYFLYRPIVDNGYLLMDFMYSTAFSAAMRPELRAQPRPLPGKTLG